MSDKPQYATIEIRRRGESAWRVLEPTPAMREAMRANDPSAFETALLDAAAAVLGGRDVEWLFS